MNEPHHKTCTLRLTANGRREECPRERCSFWEPQRSGGTCLVDRLGAEVRQPELAAYLLETRDCLDRARDLAAAEHARREFASRVGQEL